MNGGSAPVAVVELDLAACDDIDVTTTARLARVLVRSSSEPIAVVEVGVRDGVVRRTDVERALLGGEWPEAPSTDLRDVTTPPMTVVVCTRERPEDLRRCLASLCRLRYPTFEVVVVDNAPQSAATASVVDEIADVRVRRIVEPRPGLSRARNTGLCAADTELIAFTDDDVAVDEWWLHALARGFARASHVGCVTGLVLAAELDTEAQIAFEQLVSWSGLLERRLVDTGANRPAKPLFPYAPGQLGTGANMAFRRSALRATGNFDEALGAGTAARGGEDLDAFVNVLVSGQALAVEPAALVWHRHRRSDAELHAQLRNYGIGLTAYLTKQLTHPRRAGAMAWRLPQAVAHARRITRRSDGDAGARISRRGMALGPLAYARSRMDAR